MHDKIKGCHQNFRRLIFGGDQTSPADPPAGSAPSNRISD